MHNSGFSKKLAKYFFLTFLIFVLYGNSFGQEFEVGSPDGDIVVDVRLGDEISYVVSFRGRQFLNESALSLTIGGKGKLGEKPVLKKSSRRSVDNIIRPVVRQKSAEVKDRYNELTLHFERGYQVVFRVYNDGVAYRFKTDFKEDELKVKSEQVELNFAGNYQVYFPEEESFMTHQERIYKHIRLDSISSKQFSSIPALVEVPGGPRVLVTESDLQDYPGMYLQGTGATSLTGIFPAVATKEVLKSDRDYYVTERADYLAETSGQRSYPWRVLGIAADDAGLIKNQMVYKLGEPLKIEDPSWIDPGKVSWDWWNANNVYDVDFRAGINTETYKHYIDFASQMGLDYIILDEGWYELKDLLQVSENMDIPELVAYGKKKDVDIILWVVWKTLEDQWEQAFDQFSKWGVKGLKIDFMQRDDQWMVNWYWKVAEEAARRKLLVNFHGSYKPAGLRRTYPNVITREGVKGLENNKWGDKITPEHNVTLPFIRMAAGPMDYTPGAMINAQPKNFKPIYNRPMSQGTRAHQLAMYVIYESPLQMLADSPTHYLNQKQDIRDFLSEVPVTWDETRVLEASIGDYVIVARRKGDRWYLGAMSDEKERSFTLDLPFLGSGNFTADIYRDGINADRYASDYAFVEREFSADEEFTIELAPGGGWVAIIEKAQ